MSAEPHTPALPELASVPWRQLTDALWLRRWGRIWNAWTIAYTVPFLVAGGALLAIQPLAAPVALAAFAHAWIIPELYAHRGAGVLRPKGARNTAAEPTAPTASTHDTGPICASGGRRPAAGCGIQAPNTA